MREIRFRAWDKKNNVMLEPLSGVLWGKAIIPTDYAQVLFDFEIPYNYEDIVGDEMLLVKDVELMQYAGLKDKNNKEIYEGDIVFVSLQRPNGNMKIEWDDECAEFVLDGLGQRYGIYIALPTEIAIVGNIYQDAYLLEEDK